MSDLRDSRFELLRIISMFMVVLHHLSIHGFPCNQLPCSPNKIWLYSIAIGGKIGVNIFIFISGYYMCRSRFKATRILKVIGAVTFYYLGFFDWGICPVGSERT